MLQKKLCGEANCPRCANRDPEADCIGASAAREHWYMRVLTGPMPIACSNLLQLVTRCTCSAAESYAMALPCHLLTNGPAAASGVRQHYKCACTLVDPGAPGCRQVGVRAVRRLAGPLLQGLPAGALRGGAGGRPGGRERLAVPPLLRGRAPRAGAHVLQTLKSATISMCIQDHFALMYFSASPQWVQRPKICLAVTVILLCWRHMCMEHAGCVAAGADLQQQHLHEAARDGAHRHRHLQRAGDFHSRQPSVSSTFMSYCCGTN